MSIRITEHEFGDGWQRTTDLKYSESEKVEIEQLVRHILLEHSHMFSDNRFSTLHNLSFYCSGVKVTDGIVECVPAFIKELFGPASDECCPVDTSFYGFDRLITYKMLQITGARYTHAGKVELEWSLFDCPFGDEDIRFFTEFSTGKSCKTIAELLHFLNKWHTAANCFSISDSELDLLKATFSHHFHRLGRFRFENPLSMTVDFRQLTYTVQPMWNKDEPFGSIRDLRDYLNSEPVRLDTKTAANLPKFLEFLAIDTGDIPVSFDEKDFHWVTMYSGALAMYYKISVRFRGTELDHLRDFASAYRIRMHTGTVKFHEPNIFDFMDDECTEQEH